MSELTSGAATTDDLDPGRPVLTVTGPAAAAGGALLTGAAAIAFALCSITVSSAPTFSGSLVSSTGANPITSRVAGIVKSVHVRDGDSITAGEIIVSLDPAATAEKIRLLKADLEHLRRVLSEASPAVHPLADPQTAPSSDAEPAIAATTSRRIQSLHRDIASIERRLAEADDDMLKSEIVAVAPGRVGGLSWLAAGAQIDAGAVLGRIEPAAEIVVVDVAIPASVAAQLRQPGDRRVGIRARSLATASGPTWPLAAQLVSTAERERGESSARVAIHDPGARIGRVHRDGETVALVTFETGERRSLLSWLRQSTRPAASRPHGS